MYIRRFTYKKEDVDCKLCAEFRGRKKCPHKICPYITERIEAGAVTYQEAVNAMVHSGCQLIRRLPKLMQMVDEKKIALTPAYQLAALSEQEQELLVETMSSEQATPSLSQAQRMKKLSLIGELNEDTMLSIMMEQKKPVRNDIVLPGEKLRKYFPRSYSPMQMEAVIFKLLESWQRKRQHDKSR